MKAKNNSQYRHYFTFINLHSNWHHNRTTNCLLNEFLRDVWYHERMRNGERNVWKIHHCTRPISNIIRKWGRIVLWWYLSSLICVTFLWWIQSLLSSTFKRSFRSFIYSRWLLLCIWFVFYIRKSLSSVLPFRVILRCVVPPPIHVYHLRVSQFNPLLLESLNYRRIIKSNVKAYCRGRSFYSSF